MEAIDSLWKKFSLSEAEEVGVSCPKKDIPRRFILAAKYFTKRIVNVESVAPTFRPLWRSEKDVQLKDMGENKLFFIFEDECDLESVIEHEPWTYDKHLVVFERVVENVPISALVFRFSTFWIQIHGLPLHCLNSATRNNIGRSLGTLLHMTDSEEEGGKGNYVRVRVKVDVTHPLSRVRKVWSEGKVIGWATLKYKRLPNFCYWCGMVSHDDQDCERWLRSKESLKKEDQHYGDWMRAEVDLSSKKTSVTVPGYKQRSYKLAQPSTHHHEHQSDNTPVKLSLVIPEQLTADPSITKTLNSKKERINTHNSVTDFQETVGVNEEKKGPTISYSEVNVPSDIMKTITTNKDKELKREESGVFEKRAEQATLLAQPFIISTGPHMDIKPTAKPKNSLDPNPRKATWVWRVRNPTESPCETIMFDADNRRESTQIEELRPSKRQAVCSNDILDLSPMAVAEDQPR